MAAIFTIAAAVLLGAPALRLIGLAVRTGQRPELWAGLFFIGTGIGVPLRVLGAARTPTDPETALILNAVGHVFFAAGAVALLAFTRGVFRPGSRGASVVCGAAMAGIVISTIAVFATGSINDESATSVLATNLLRVGSLAWAFGESFRYWRMMRRRVSLGLGDPVVTDRFRLWSIWTAALALAPLGAAVARIAARSVDGIAATDVTASPYFDTGVATIRVAVVLCAPMAVYGIWMSFFPPARYLARLQARSAQTPG